MGCEKFQTTPGIFSSSRVHGGDQLFLVLMKCRAPLLLGLQIDEVFGIEKAGGVGPVIRPADLTGALGHFGPGAEQEPA